MNPSPMILMDSLPGGRRMASARDEIGGTCLLATRADVRAARAAWSFRFFSRPKYAKIGHCEMELVAPRASPRRLSATVVGGQPSKVCDQQLRYATPACALAIHRARCEHLALTEAIVE